MARGKPLTGKDAVAAAEYDFAHPNSTAKEVGAAINLHEDAVLRVRKMDEYERHFTKLLHEQFYGLRQLALKVMEDKLMSGNIKAAEYILDNTGFKEADKVEVTNNEIVVTIE